MSGNRFGEEGGGAWLEDRSKKEAGDLKVVDEEDSEEERIGEQGVKVE